MDHGTTSHNTHEQLKSKDRNVLTRLELTDIGPFRQANIDLGAPPDGPPITVFTGDNGTGKSIVLDSIRAAFGPPLANVTRPLARHSSTDTAHVALHIHPRVIHFKPSLSAPYGSPGSFGRRLVQEWMKDLKIQRGPGLVLDYWSSGLDSGEFKIEQYQPPRPEEYLDGCLSGRHANQDLTRDLCFFDMLRDSRIDEERVTGEALWSAIETIVTIAVPQCTRIQVARTRFEPQFSLHHGEPLPLNALSSGSLHLLARMIGLLRRMYGAWKLSAAPERQIAHTPGLLLIDEAENHLHPRWQKRLLPSLRSAFPNVQIIVATHSPFVVSSVYGARIMHCSHDGDAAIITDVSGAFTNQPVDEVLMSEAFGYTAPYAQAITDQLDARRRAMQTEDRQARAEAEAELYRLNPDAFGYLRLDELMRKVSAS